MPAATQETGFINWNPFTGDSLVVLTLVMLAIAALLFYGGSRMKKQVRLPMPWRWLKVVIVLVWILQILILLKVFKHIATVDPQAGVTGPVFPITLASALGTFLYVIYSLRRDGTGTALGGGFLAAVAGPMVFELPFILIVGPGSTTPTDPGATLTVPFFIVLFLTLAMLSFSSRAAITRYSVYALAGMFLVFAFWAALGFAYPSDSTLLVLNSISKVLGFVTTAAMFRPRK